MSEATRPEPSSRLADSAGRHGNRDSALHDVAARWRSPDSNSLPALAGNVIRLRTGRFDGEPAPHVFVAAGARPAPWNGQSRQLPRWLILISVSAAAHAALYLPFRHAPAPMASMGEVAVSVELVLGADQHAGLSPDNGTSQASAPTPSQTPEITPAQTPPPPAPVATVPVETTVEQPENPAKEGAAAPQPHVEVAAATATDAQPAINPVMPIEPAAETPPIPAPVQAEPRPEATTEAELQVSVNPIPPETTLASPAEPNPDARPTQVTETAAVERPAETTAMSVALPTRTAFPEERPRQRQARPAPTRPERTKMAVRERPKRAERQATRGERSRSNSTSPAAVASGGVGRGRSDANSNYRGMVAAHLARHKRFPAEARSLGREGSATVMFSINGGGRVTSVRLARGSGVASLDQEATAMVHRASPFPAPPDGRGTSFTVPVSFRLN